MLATLALAGAMLGSQTVIQGFPKVAYEIPIAGGQREMALGIRHQSETLLNYFYEKEVNAQYIPNGINDGQPHETIQPQNWVEKNLGYMRWSVRPDDIFNQKANLLTTESLVRQRVGPKDHQYQITSMAKTQWWISDKGKILRQYYQLQSPMGDLRCNATYGTDSVEVSRETPQGTKFLTMFPSGGMEALDAQFTPMLAGGKVLLPEKKFQVLNLQTGSVDDYEAKISGKFNCQYMNVWFKGQCVDITGPGKLTEKAYLSDEGDLVKVEFSEEKYWVIQSLPSSKLDKNGLPIRGSGG